MQTTVDLAPGAEQNRLAVHFSSAIREAIKDVGRSGAFRALKATVLIVPFDVGDSVTLRFDFGRVVIHDGHVGVPTLTLGGPAAELEKLPEVSDRGLRDFLLSLLGRRPSHPLGGWIKLFATGELRGYGILSHPRATYRFLRTLAVPSP